MKKQLKITGLVVLALGAAWTALTIWAERTGPKRSWQLGSQTAKKRALIVYNPDPVYNLDEQVSRSFGQALADGGMYVRVASVAAAETDADQPVDLYVFCANTYNFRPDWAVSNFIRRQADLAGKSVVAITLGSGSTEASQNALETLIQNKRANLLDSRSLWLLKPNDKSRMRESNVAVSVSMAYAWGAEMAKRYGTDPAVSARSESVHQP
ncbi:hypothetical protein [Spirosoma arcticum]